MVGGWVGKEGWSDVKGKKRWAQDGDSEVQMEIEWLGLGATTVLGLFLAFLAALYIEMTASEISGYHTSVSEFCVCDICIRWIGKRLCMNARHGSFDMAELCRLIAPLLSLEARLC